MRKREEPKKYSSTSKISKAKFKKTKALVLVSGGLDSLLVVKLLQNQGIEVEAVYFATHFDNTKNLRWLDFLINNMNVKINKMNVEPDYLDMLKKPKYGYGKNMNPCIDCHAYMLRKTKRLLKERDAQIIATGEVLDERPMSQTMKALDIVEKEAGLKNAVLRPLSAKLLPKTVYEIQGLVDREKLLDIHGRQRTRQLELAKKYGIEGFNSPAGGCLLTEKEFAKKVKDLIEKGKSFDFDDVELLKIGRHFRFKECKIIVGRNEYENDKIIQLAKDDDLLFEAVSIPSPVTLLRIKERSTNSEYINAAALLTACYSDAARQGINELEIEYRSSKKDSTIIVEVDLKKCKEFKEKYKV